MGSFESIYNANAVYFWLGLVVLVLLLAGLNVGLVERLRRRNRPVPVVLAGEVDQKQLNQVLAQYNEEIARLEGALQRHEEGLTQLKAQQPHNLQLVGLVRFSAYQDVGGDQSYALALLDQQGSGVILSSLHGRGGTRYYAKQVQQGRSSYALSDEEKQAMEQAYETAPAEIKSVIRQGKGGKDKELKTPVS